MRNTTRLLSIEEIMERYKNGESSTSIAKDAGVSDRHIRRLINQYGAEYGVETRAGGQPRKHQVNENFFKTWTPEMAYVLGFVLTDGHVKGNALTISQKDVEILRKIAKVMNCTNEPVKKKTQDLYVLIINSKEIVHDLRKLGITERKSRTVKMPNVPEKYLPHFIRGVLDGDGHVHFKGYRVTITSGSLSFAESLTEILNNHGFTAELLEQTAHKSNNSIYRVVLSGKTNVWKFGEWIYKNKGELFLERKISRIFSY